MPDVPPLRGVRVLELSRTLAAPFAGQMLADFGADVIKVERPGQGDESRRIGPTFLTDSSGQPTAEGSMYLAANRNKRSITVDLSRSAGQEIIKRIARQSDILVENYKPGGLARYGLDYESLRVANPRLVYCSVSGFGHSGPHSPRAGYDPIFQAMAGWMSVNGADRPMLVNSNVVDMMAAYHSVIGILAALRERDEHSGHGQHIDIALLDVAIAAFAHRAQDFLLTGHQPPRRTNRGIVFPCADGEVVIAVGNEGHWVRFCDLLGRADLASDPRYRDHPSRVSEAAGLYPLLESLTRKFSWRDLVSKLEDADIPHGLIADYQTVFEHEQVKARDLVRETSHPSGARLSLVANPVRFSRTPMDRYQSPPVLGQHTAEVLAGLLGMSNPDIGALARDQVI